MKNLHFLLKNLHFLLKNLHFLLKNLHFLVEEWLHFCVKCTGFTNCPDAFQLDDGRWVFAYLSHSTQYAGTRILSFVGTCDDKFNCSWPVAGQGQYDQSSNFIASQSFTGAIRMLAC